MYSVLLLISRDADRRAFKTEAEHAQRLSANHQQVAHCRASESEADHVQFLAVNQQWEAFHRASESDTQRKGCL